MVQKILLAGGFADGVEGCDIDFVERCDIEGVEGCGMNGTCGCDKVAVEG